MVEINLPIVVGAAVIDGINPCAFGVLIFLLAYLSKQAIAKRRMLVQGSIYIFAVFLTYLTAGIILLPVIKSLGALSVYAYVALGILIIIAGLIEIKDMIWYGRGFSLTIFPKEAERIKQHKKNISKGSLKSFSLGVMVAFIELPCTGAVYIAVLALMSTAGLSLSNWAYLVVYNLIFVLPLFVILWLFYKGVSTKRFEAWRKKHRQLMRGITGALLIALGIWMVVSLI